MPASRKMSRERDSDLMKKGEKGERANKRNKRKRDGEEGEGKG